MTWLLFLLAALVIVASGTQLPRYGDMLGEKTGLGSSWIGLVLLSATTSLPELGLRTALPLTVEAANTVYRLGKTIVIVANLAPRNLMGLESNGLVLAASPDGGAAIVLNVEPATPGTRVR